jgi:hypothetical protein
MDGEDSVMNSQVDNIASTNNPSKTRYAVVGLGAFAQSDALPAFAEAKNSELTALVSGDANIVSMQLVIFFNLNQLLFLLLLPITESSIFGR